MARSPILTRNTINEWLLALVLCTGVAGFMWAYHDWWRAKPYSLATANECLALGAQFGLCAALALGPLSRFFPLAFKQAYRLRRPLGLMSVPFATVHVWLTLFPLSHDYGWPYFTREWLMLCLGIGAAIILLLLSVLSTTKMLKKVGADRWRQIQQYAYLALLLILCHFLALGKVNAWLHWIQTRNLPAPPGTLIFFIVGLIPLALKAMELVLEMRRRPVALPAKQQPTTAVK